MSAKSPLNMSPNPSEAILRSRVIHTDLAWGVWALSIGVLRPGYFILHLFIDVSL